MMTSRFYHRHSQRLLLCALATCLPLLTLVTYLESNNSVEAWLPTRSAVIARYERFKRDFGAEEFVLVAVEGCTPEAELLEGLAQRLERLSGIRRCWTPERMKRLMGSLGVAPDVADGRIEGLLVSADGHLSAVQAVLSEEGLRDRSATVTAVYRELEACGLAHRRPEETPRPRNAPTEMRSRCATRYAYLAGPPVVEAALGYWGSALSGAKLLGGTLLVSWMLCVVLLGSWRTASLLIAAAVYAAVLSLAAVKLSGTQMNFILTALPTMVVVLTLAVAIHFVHYYRWSLHQADPVGAALRLAWKPCVWCTTTTAIGFASLSVSRIMPVRQFGLAASGGALVALLVGLGLVPAILSVWPESAQRGAFRSTLLLRLGGLLRRRHRMIALTSLAAIAAAALGLRGLRSELNPIALIPKHSKVVEDYRVLESRLSGMARVEAVVDFGSAPGTFFERLGVVRRIEQAIAAHPGVRSTLSLADFFPDPEQTQSGGIGGGLRGSIATLRTITHAAAHHTDSGYRVDGGQRWRISAWVPASGSWDFGALLSELNERVKPPAKSNEHTEAATTPVPQVDFTGVVPLLDTAQSVIFQSFCESFLLAFAVIAVVMTLTLRSVRMAATVMVPNLAPLVLVFGGLSWLEVPLDIGTMMTASIALGITIDATLHFCVRQREHAVGGLTLSEAVERTLLQCGTPIVKTALVTGMGLLVLAASPFTPTTRFGWLMALLLGTAVIGDLVLLPALWMWFGPKPRSKDEKGRADSRRHEGAAFDARPKTTLRNLPDRTSTHDAQAHV